MQQNVIIWNEYREEAITRILLCFWESSSRGSTDGEAQPSVMLVACPEGRPFPRKGILFLQVFCSSHEAELTVDCTLNE